MKKFVVALLAVAMCLFLSACDSDVVWFEEKDTGQPKAYEDGELTVDTYYIKQGTRFYKTYEPSYGAKGLSNTVKSDRVMAIYDTNMIPSHYKGELVAYSSNKNMLTSVTLERFKCLGYSIGVFNGYIDESGYFYVDRKKNINQDSSFYNAIKNDTSNDIRIVTIDGNILTNDILDTTAGAIVNLEKDREYTVGYFSGTFYNEVKVKADTMILQSYEMYGYDQNQIDFSANGYISFKTPEDLMSGYYYINGSGLFAYYDHERGGDDNEDMNVSYFASDRERIEAYSRQYTVDINTKVKDAKIVVSFVRDYDVETEDIAGYVYAPNGTEYDMKLDEQNNQLYLNLTEAAIGEWVVNVTPKTLNITDVTCDSTKVEEEATLQQQDFVFPEEQTNMVFSATTSGEGEVFGYVVTDDGRTYDMTYDYDEKEKTGRIYYELAYVPAGSYQVKVYYHPTTTDLSEITAESNLSTDTDVIYVGD